MGTIRGSAFIKAVGFSGAAGDSATLRIQFDDALLDFAKVSFSIFKALVRVKTRRISTCPITTKRDLAAGICGTGTLAVVATPLRGCKNLVNGLINSRHSLGESINGKTSTLRVCARDDIVSSRLHPWVCGFRGTIPIGGHILALAARK